MELTEISASYTEAEISPWRAPSVGAAIATWLCVALLIRLDKVVGSVQPEAWAIIFPLPDVAMVLVYSCGLGLVAWTFAPLALLFCAAQGAYIGLTVRCVGARRSTPSVVFGGLLASVHLGAMLVAWEFLLPVEAVVEGI
jgi:hypothetical protein